MPAVQPTERVPLFDADARPLDVKRTNRAIVATVQLTGLQFKTQRMCCNELLLKQQKIASSACLDLFWILHQVIEGFVRCSH